MPPKVLPSHSGFFDPQVELIKKEVWGIVCKFIDVET